MKKFSAIAILVSATLSSAAFASDGHTMWEGSTDRVLKEGFEINGVQEIYDFAKYADGTAKLKLLAAASDGKLTYEEIKDANMQPYHFYTGYLASSKDQGEYDKRYKELTGLDSGTAADHYVSNRDLKAHGSMIVNHVSRDMKAAHNYYDNRMTQIADGLQQLGDHVGSMAPGVTPEYKVHQATDKDGNKVDGLIGYSYTDSNGQTRTGYKVVREDYTFIDENGQSVTVAGAGDNYDNLQNNVKEAIDSTAVTEVSQKVDDLIGYIKENGGIGGNGGTVDGVSKDEFAQAFQAQAAHTTAEIARLDGRIDALEEKTDKMKAGIAGANAIGSLTQYTGSGTHHFAVGVGGYEDAAAIAAGYTHALDKNTTIRATIAYDSEGSIGYGVSYGHSW